MLFSVIFSIISVFLLAQRSLAALTPNGVVVNIKLVATASSDANMALSAVSTETDLATAVSIAKTLANNFSGIISSLTADITAMQATPPFTDSVTEPIVDALTDFVLIHQALLSTVIGKHGIFAQFGVTAPIAFVLGSLEAGIDSFAFAMINLIPTRKGDVQTGKANLDQSVTESIKTYSQFCIPSILYPTIMPICIPPIL